MPIKAFLSLKSSLPHSATASRYPSLKHDAQTGASDITAFPSAPARCIFNVGQAVAGCLGEHVARHGMLVEGRSSACVRGRQLSGESGVGGGVD